jgi:hypothetical protein
MGSQAKVYQTHSKVPGQTNPRAGNQSDGAKLGAISKAELSDGYARPTSR